jgi:hypothetical protein
VVQGRRAVMLDSRLRGNDGKVRGNDEKCW